MANSYLSRSGSTPTNSKKFTYSFWVKRSTLSADQAFLSYETDSNNRGGIELQSGDKFRYFERVSGSNTIVVEPSRVFRDPAAWYHIVVATDTTQSTASDRVKIYVNGVQETDFSTATYPSLNSDTRANGSTVKNIGRRNVNDDYYFDGYLSHAVFVDGSALAPTVFGQTDSTSGIWKFKGPTGVTFGNNGFHLKFENSGALGTDSSGNSNTFTVNGNLKQSIDTPSIVYPTWNPLAQPGGTLSNGNLSNTSAHDTPATFGVTTGKWYWEYKRTNTGTNLHYGICSTKLGFNRTTNQMLNGESDSVGAAIYIYQSGTGTTGYANAGAFSSVSYSGVSTPSIANGDIVGCALDISSASGTLTFYKNGSSMGAVTFTYDQVTPVYPFIRMNSGATSDVNFGTGLFGPTAISSAGSNGNGSLFEYDVPSNHYALNTKNINTYG